MNEIMKKQLTASAHAVVMQKAYQKLSHSQVCDAVEMMLKSRPDIARGVAQEMAHRFGGRK